MSVQRYNSQALLNNTKRTANMTLDEGRLKDAERLIRFAMVVTLCTAGISKFFSHGAFNQYYGELFRNPQLRIHLSKLLRRWVSLLDAVYGARHWPGSLVHAPETLFYAHLVHL